MNRDNSIDAVAGILIIYMIFIHAFQCLYFALYRFVQNENELTLHLYCVRSTANRIWLSLQNAQIHPAQSIK